MKFDKMHILFYCVEIERGKMKKIVITIIFFILFVCPHFSNVYAEDTLYFDNQGNFVFGTYNKKATTSTKYSTIGWVVKKYDDSMTSQGQLYALIPVPQVYYEVEDKQNPGYIYVYFFVQKDDILSRIGAVSSSWRSQLENYGDDVYLDSIMTVLESGVAKGSISSSGKMTGEVYCTYQGIAGARGWAKPELLKSYYDIKVTFPALVQEKTIVYTEKDKKDEKISNTPISSVSLSSNEFNVAEGIPSGENIFTMGISDNIYYNVTMQKHIGVVSVPVKVETNYLLKWKDSSGVQKSVTKKVTRWYYVAKDYEYYTIKDYQVLDLKSVLLKSTLFPDGINIPLNSSHSETKKEYATVANHLSAKAITVSAGTVTVNATGKYKPDIPNDNQQNIANNAVGSILSYNDTLYINGKSVTKNGLSGEMTRSTFSKENINIPIKISNGEYSDISATFNYSNQSQTKQIINNNINKVMVHTPVVCTASVTTSKLENMHMEPTANQIVQGTTFSIKSDSYGTHLSIKGYGTKDYSKYIGLYKVKFPFKVTIDNKTYSENTWIDMPLGMAYVYISENVKTGIYKIEVANIAKNNGYFTGNSLCFSEQEKYNKNRNYYGASDLISVEVIGKLWDFAVDNQNVKALPCDVSKKGAVELKIKSSGIGDAINDNIIGELSFFHIDEKGNRTAVDVYSATNKALISGKSVKALADQVIWKNKNLISNGIYEWNISYELGENIIIVPKGTKVTDVNSAVKNSKKEGMLVINVQIYGCTGEKKVLSYINSVNSAKGYCNRWKKEGFIYENVEKGAKYLDGDCMIFNSIENIYGVYSVIGTH